MLRNAFRPWGLLSWVLDHLPPTTWHLVGLGCEERCLSAHELLRARGQLADIRMLKIGNVSASSSPWGTITAQRLATRQAEYLARGGSLHHIFEHDLHERDELLVSEARQCTAAFGPNVVVDISSLPKRFFFVLVKVLLSAGHIQNLIATYTVPVKYAEDEPLAEDPEPRQYLHSMFMPNIPEPKVRTHIVGVGYEPLGLPQALEGEEFQLLFPFPSPPPGFQRNWEFVRELEPYVNTRPHLVYTYDVSETFDRIIGLSNGGTRFVIFSPYGPKPMSLAMCLYAVSSLTHGQPPAVFYTQPTMYNPLYSEGVSTQNGQAKIVSYCIRLNGRDLY
jgi:hypothetical protein